MSLRESAKQIVCTLRDGGFEAYFVGGCVRDMLLGVEPHDIDIATSALPRQTHELFSDVLDVGAAFGVTRVRVGEDWFEVAAFRSDKPYTDGRRPDGIEFTDARGDVERRDFTINGLLYDPLTDTVLDYVGGRADIKRQLLRCIGDPPARFAEDKLRLLRAVRFAARLEYDIEAATLQALQEAAHTISVVSAERIGTEVLHTFTGAHADRALQLLRDTGLLQHVMPEVDAMVGVRQPDRFHPEGDVFEHTKMMLGLMSDPSPELALAVLLHDVGKPPTYEEADRIRFNEHARVGAEMAGRICRRLCMPRVVSDVVTELVATHMRFIDIRDMKESRLKRFMRQPLFEDALDLHRLDCVASHGNLDTWAFCKEQFDSLGPEHIRPPRLVTGYDLIEMGYSPGPQFAEILTAVEDAQLEGRLSSRTEAIEFVHRTFPRR